MLPVCFIKTKVMKRYLFAPALAALLVLGAGCENKKEEAKDTDAIYNDAQPRRDAAPEPDPAPAPTQRVSPSDNQTDAGGKRQGHWVITGRMEDGSVGVEARVEEGNYVNGVRHGVWTTYNPDGSVRATVTYDMGVIVK